MPSQPAWFHRLDEILGALRSMTSPHLDRAAVEKLFRVRQRRARQIMVGLDLARRQLAAQHVRIPAAVDVRERLLEDLSASQGQMEAQRSGVATMETALPRLRGHVGQCSSLRSSPVVLQLPPGR